MRRAPRWQLLTSRGRGLAVSDAERVGAPGEGLLALACLASSNRVSWRGEERQESTDLFFGLRTAENGTHEMPAAVISIGARNESENPS